MSVQATKTRTMPGACHIRSVSLISSSKGCEENANERGIGKPLPDKIVRIFVSSDPDATDSSSDEEEYDPWRRIPCMRAPPLKPKPPEKESVTVYMYKKENKNKSKTNWSYRHRTTFPEFPGARIRPWGKWISEIRDPFQNKRIWLGTYNTAEEASRVHLAKKREFEEKKLAQAGLKCIQESESAGTSSSTPNRSEEEAEKGSNLGPEYDPWRQMPMPCMSEPLLKLKPRKKESVTIYMYKKENKNKSKTNWSYRYRTTFPKFPGARIRPWGKWISEIRDPFQNKRIWLGTYDTAEEASRVHLAKKHEFEEKKLAQAGLICIQESESAGTSSSTPNRSEEAEKGSNLGPES